jgi:hypothetical protein
MATAQQIVDDVAKYVGSDSYSTWYAGIASDAEDCLFNRHKVNKQSGRWIYRGAPSSAIARSAEAALHEGGFDGGPGGGSETTKTVYAYKKTGLTSEA